MTTAEEADAFAAHLKSWAQEIADISGGRTSAQTLLDAALSAWIDGKDLNEPSLRQTLIASASNETPHRL